MLTGRLSQLSLLTLESDTFVSIDNVKIIDEFTKTIVLTPPNVLKNLWGLT